MLCYDKEESEEAKRYAEYRTFEDILSECDVISLHLPLTDESYHIIDKSALNRTKNGVILINTARGPLIDTEALIHALESGKVGGAAIVGARPLGQPIDFRQRAGRDGLLLLSARINCKQFLRAVFMVA